MSFDTISMSFELSHFCHGRCASLDLIVILQSFPLESLLSVQNIQHPLAARINHLSPYLSYAVIFRLPLSLLRLSTRRPPTDLSLVRKPCLRFLTKEQSSCQKAVIAKPRFKSSLFPPSSQIHQDYVAVIKQKLVNDANGSEPWPSTGSLFPQSS